MRKKSQERNLAGGTSEKPESNVPCDCEMRRTTCELRSTDETEWRSTEVVGGSEQPEGGRWRWTEARCRRHGGGAGRRGGGMEADRTGICELRLKITQQTKFFQFLKDVFFEKYGNKGLGKNTHISPYVMQKSVYACIIRVLYVRAYNTCIN